MRMKVHLTMHLAMYLKACKEMCQSIFFNKFIKKEILAQVFSCELCKIFNNSYFKEHLTGSGLNHFVARVS